MIRIAILIALLCLFSSVPVLAWDGYDNERGTSIEIEKGNLVRPGQEIEFYDHEKGEYRYGDVESIQRYGSGVEVEVYDNEEGETRTFDMD
jgi:hypothetical protein